MHCSSMGLGSGPPPEQRGWRRPLAPAACRWRCRSEGPAHVLPPQGGAVMGRSWQPHESHIPYLLQLKIDFNLAGMGWLRLGRARFRCAGRRGTGCRGGAGGATQGAAVHALTVTCPAAKARASGPAAHSAPALPTGPFPPLCACRRPPLPAAFSRQRRGWATRHLLVESEPGADSLLGPGGGSAGAAPAGTPGGSASQSMRLWTEGSTPRSWVWGGGPGGAGARGRVPQRQSTCQLELDASVEHILNRQQVGQGAPPARRHGLRCHPLNGWHSRAQQQLRCIWWTLKLRASRPETMHGGVFGADHFRAPRGLTNSPPLHLLPPWPCSWCACRWRRPDPTSAWWRAWPPCGPRRRRGAAAAASPRRRPRRRAHRSRWATLWRLCAASLKRWWLASSLRPRRCPRLRWAHRTMSRRSRRSRLQQAPLRASRRRLLVMATRRWRPRRRPCRSATGAPCPPRRYRARRC